MEVYRSGHNGPDSKSGDGKPSVGSNPTASVLCAIRFLPYGFFMSESIPHNPVPAAWESFFIYPHGLDKRLTKTEPERIFLAIDKYATQYDPCVTAFTVNRINEWCAGKAAYNDSFYPGAIGVA